uniref:Uncharacterized protein n=1 Tax=Arundo donax TaxID=35708 RepID=A0A0A8Z4I3_ARUDO
MGARASGGAARDGSDEEDER